MDIVSVNVGGYKSIRHAVLDDCGRFNVLIGKNNSGKSNFLLAIELFFSCLASGTVLHLNPKLKSPIDFYENGSENSIGITLLFKLNQDERRDIVADIIFDAPQMKYAADNLAQDLWLSVTLTLLARPRPFAYISQLSLHPSGALEATHKVDILGIGSAAANEIYRNFSLVKAKEDQIANMESISVDIDEDAWQSLRGGEQTARNYVRYVLGRRLSGTQNEAIVEHMIKLVQESPTHTGFKELLQTTISALHEEVKDVQENLLSNKIITFAGEADALPLYIHNLLKKISQIRFLRLSEQRKQIGKEEASKLLRLKTRRGGPETLQNIQQTISALLGVRVDAFEGEGTVSARENNAELDVDDFLVEVNGSGVREALRLILDVEFQHPQILLVEEPEIHLHPALETSMMRFLKRVSSSTQVFITTHSTNFLDTAEMRNVYLISKNDSTQAQMLNLAEAEDQLPSELGIRLSSLFMYDRLIFVEGMSDEAIIREFASTLNVNLSQANVGFVHMGGVRNFAHFAVEATLSFLKKRQVKMWFLMDRDERDEPEIAKIKDRAGINARVHILEKREIENYLLSQRALADFINLKAGHVVATEEEVKSALIECAENLKLMSIDKRVAKKLCEPVYPNRSRLFDPKQAAHFKDKLNEELQAMILCLQESVAKIDAMYEDQSRLVEGEWMAKKFDLVPGYELLDSVCKKYSL